MNTTATAKMQYKKKDINFDVLINKIKIYRVNNNINISFKKMVENIKILKQLSDNYIDWMNITKIQNNKCFSILNILLNKFQKNKENFFYEQFNKQLKKKFLIDESAIKKIMVALKQNIKNKKAKIIINNIFVNKDNVFRKIFRRKGRGNFSYNKKNFIKVYLELKYKKINLENTKNKVK